MNIRKKCVKCGTSGASNFCPNCGEKLRDTADVFYYDKKRVVKDFDKTHREIYGLSKIVWYSAEEKICSFYPEADTRFNREDILRAPLMYQTILNQIPDAADELYNKLHAVIKDFMATYEAGKE